MSSFQTIDELNAYVKNYELTVPEYSKCVADFLRFGSLYFDFNALDLAESYLMRVLKSHPHCQKARMLLARIACRRGEFRSAFDILKSVYKRYGDEDALFELVALVKTVAVIDSEVLTWIKDLIYKYPWCLNVADISKHVSPSTDFEPPQISDYDAIFIGCICIDRHSPDKLRALDGFVRNIEIRILESKEIDSELLSACLIFLLHLNQAYMHLRSRALCLGPLKRLYELFKLAASRGLKDTIIGECVAGIFMFLGLLTIKSDEVVDPGKDAVMRCLYLFLLSSSYGLIDVNEVSPFRNIWRRFSMERHLIVSFWNLSVMKIYNFEVSEVLGKFQQNPNLLSDKTEEQFSIIVDDIHRFAFASDRTFCISEEAAFKSLAEIFQLCPFEFELFVWACSCLWRDQPYQPKHSLLPLIAKRMRSNSLDHLKISDNFPDSSMTSLCIFDMFAFFYGVVYEFKSKCPQWSSGIVPPFQFCNAVLEPKYSQWWKVAVNVSVLAQKCVRKLNLLIDKSIQSNFLDGLDKLRLKHRGLDLSAQYNIAKSLNALAKNSADSFIAYGALTYSLRYFKDLYLRISRDALLNRESKGPCDDLWFTGNITFHNLMNKKGSLSPMEEIKAHYCIFLLETNCTVQAMKLLSELSNAKLWLSDPSFKHLYQKILDTCERMNLKLPEKAKELFVEFCADQHSTAMQTNEETGTGDANLIVRDSHYLDDLKDVKDSISQIANVLSLLTLKLDERLEESNFKFGTVMKNVSEGIDLLREDVWRVNRNLINIGDSLSNIKHQNAKHFMDLSVNCEKICLKIESLENAVSRLSVPSAVSYHPLLCPFLPGSMPGPIYSQDHNGCFAMHYDEMGACISSASSAQSGNAYFPMQYGEASELVTNMSLNMSNPEMTAPLSESQVHFTGTDEHLMSSPSLNLTNKDIKERTVSEMEQLNSLPLPDSLVLFSSVARIHEIDARNERSKQFDCTLDVSRSLDGPYHIFIKTDAGTKKFDINENDCLHFLNETENAAAWTMSENALQKIMIVFFKFFDTLETFSAAFNRAKIYNASLDKHKALKSQSLAFAAPAENLVLDVRGLTSNITQSGSNFAVFKEKSTAAPGNLSNRLFWSDSTKTLNCNLNPTSCVLTTKSVSIGNQAKISEESKSSVPQAGNLFLNLNLNSSSCFSGILSHNFLNIPEPLFGQKPFRHLPSLSANAFSSVTTAGSLFPTTNLTSKAFFGAGTQQTPEPMATKPVFGNSFRTNLGLDKSADSTSESTEDTLKCDDENYDPYYEPVVKMPEHVDVKSGEENEVVLFEAQSRLYRYADEQWKERGRGVVKILKALSGKSRLLFRRERVHNVACNHYISAHTNMSPLKSSTLSYCWIATDYSENMSGQPEKFCIRFKEEKDANEFLRIVDQVKSEMNK